MNQILNDPELCKKVMKDELNAVARWLRGAMYKEMVRTGTPVWPDKK